jgi:hypothetical protein
MLGSLFVHLSIENDIGILNMVMVNINLKLIAGRAGM